MAIFAPKILLNSVDFPTLGRPMMATRGGDPLSIEGNGSVGSWLGADFWRGITCRTVA